MTIERAKRLAEQWASGGVCSLREGEAEEYHKMFLEMLLEKSARESNAPLSLDELRKIYVDEEGPIWVVFGQSCWPAILDSYDGELVAVWSASVELLRESDYGKTWIAYRSKPEVK